MRNRKSRYRFFSVTTQRPVLLEDDRTKTDQPDQPVRQSPTQDQEPLVHVDQSQGGYGGGSGFAPDRT